MNKLCKIGTFVAVASLFTVPVSLHWSQADGPSLSTDVAQARIGRPLTPMSFAGVNRRVHRRAYRHAYYYGGYAYRPYHYRYW